MEKSCIWNFNYVENENRLPKSWEDFCEMYPIKDEEYFISTASVIVNALPIKGTSERLVVSDSNVLPDRATAEAVLALCKLIQLRNCYNGDWKPDWTDSEKKWVILFSKKSIEKTTCTYVTASELYFKSEELRDEFLRNFRPLIEKLKPLYGIREGGEE